MEERTAVVVWLNELKQDKGKQMCKHTELIFGKKQDSKQYGNKLIN